MSQKAMILQYLRKHRFITTMTAIKKFGCTTCSQRCTDLKRDGYKIDTIFLDGNKYAHFVLRTHRNN